MMPFRLFPLLILCVFAACTGPETQYEFSGQTMGTTYNIVVVDTSQSLDREELRTSVEATLIQFNADYSNWDPDSEISRFNAQKSTEFIEISPGLREMLEISNEIHLATAGLFDLTLKPLIELWGFGASTTGRQQPDNDAILAAKQKVGMTRVLELSAEGSRLRKLTPEATIDLSAIAKGYGIDAVAETLKELGAENFMVEIGGDLYVHGQTIRNAAWRIGIEQPDASDRSLQAIVDLSNVGMATSGDYRNYFEEDGVRYSHIIDANTGRPITHKTASVTVLAESSALADAWATALLAVGDERGLQIADEHDIAALFVMRRNDSEPSGFIVKTNELFSRYQPAQKD